MSEHNKYSEWMNDAMMAYRMGIRAGKQKKEPEIVKLTMMIGNLTKENNDLKKRIAELEEAYVDQSRGTVWKFNTRS